MPQFCVKLPHGFCPENTFSQTYLPLLCYIVNMATADYFAVAGKIFISVFPLFCVYTKLGIEPFRLPGVPRCFCPDQYSKTAYEPLFEEILNEWDNKEIGYAHRCNSILSNILYKIEKEQFRRGTGNNYDIASRAAAIIERHLGDSGFALAEISGMLKISDAYLRMNFKNKFGITLKEYQTILRLKHARMLLETQYFPIKDISHK